jgi:hypothetical protein
MQKKSENAMFQHGHWMLQNTSKSDRDTVTTQRRRLKYPKTTFSWITSDRVCVPCLLAAMWWKSTAERFPEFLAASPLKREDTFANEEAWRRPNGEDRKVWTVRKAQDVLRPPPTQRPQFNKNSYDCTVTQ